MSAVPIWVKVLACSPLHVLWDGSEAVMIFFALSGFVLMLPFLKADKPTYGSFLVKRICRIHPTCWLVLIASAAVMIIVHPTTDEHISIAYRSAVWVVPPAFSFWGYFLLLGGNPQLLRVIWSLFYEVRVSLFFPKLATAVVRSSKRSLLIGGLLYLGAALSRLSGVGQNFSGLTLTIDYGFVFLCGALLAKHRDEVRARFCSLTVWQRVGLRVLAVLLYNARWELILVRPSYADSEMAQALVRSGAVLILALVVASPRLERWLSRPVLVWFGKISYSLYLVHFVILTAFMYSPLRNVLPMWVLGISVVPCSLATAAALYRFAERPSVCLGRFLTSMNYGVVTSHEKNAAVAG